MTPLPSQPTEVDMLLNKETKPNLDLYVIYHRYWVLIIYHIYPTPPLEQDMT